MCCSLHLGGLEVGSKSNFKYILTHIRCVLDLCTYFVNITVTKNKIIKLYLVSVPCISVPTDTQAVNQINRPC